MISVIDAGVGMSVKHATLIFYIFRLRVVEISNRYEMGEAYIKGQLDEAHHQLMLSVKKKNYGERHG